MPMFESTVYYLKIKLKYIKKIRVIQFYHTKKKNKKFIFVLTLYIYFVFSYLTTNIIIILYNVSFLIEFSLSLG